MTVTTMPTTVTILVRVLQVPELPDVSGCKPYWKEFDAGSLLYAAARIATGPANHHCHFNSSEKLRQHNHEQ